MDVPSEQLFSFLTAVRTAALSPPPPAPKLGPLSWGDALEVQGPSGSGKSRLVYTMLATCIMPPSHNFVVLGGWGKAAVLYDTDNTFDPHVFHELLLLRLQRALARANTSSDDAQLLATLALQRLHIFRPASSAQLAVSIYHLPAYHKTRIADADIGLLALDSLSAFYWPDRFTAEQLRLPNGPTPLHHILTALQAFRISHKPVTIFTNWGLTLADKSVLEPSAGPTAAYKQHLPTFPTFPSSAVSHNAPHDLLSNTLSLTHHVTLHSVSAPPVHGDVPFPNHNQDITGYIRKSGSSQVVRFVVDIQSNDAFY